MASLSVASILLVLVAHSAAQVGTFQGSCLDNLTACRTNFQQLLVDEDKFWFGNGFAAKCPTVPGFGSTASPQCQNPDPTRKSILSRVLKTDDAALLQQVSQTVSLATLSFTAPATEFYACGHDFTYPAVTNYYIDPLKVITLDQAQVDYRPSFTWNAAPNTLYTIIVIDVGYYFSHGVYINAEPGSPDQWEAVDKYHGSRNGQPKAMPYLFMAIPQTSRLDLATATGVMNGITFANNFKLNVPSFLQQLGFASDATQRMSASLMSMYGDTFGAEKSQEFSSANWCPYFASAQPVLKKALAQAKIPATFSTDARSYLTSLTMDVQPLYSAEDIKFQSCCSNQDVARSQLLVDAFSTRSQMPVQLRNKPRVTFSLMEEAAPSFTRGPKYTLMLVDLGAPSSFPTVPEADPKFVVHWLVVNIENLKDLSTGQEAKPYFGSNPFTPNQPRMYTVLLMEQTQDVDVTTLSTYSVDGTRYSVSRLLQGWGLSEIRGVTWWLAEQDAFARMRMYDTWAARTGLSAKDVCGAVEGFTYPCPMTCQGVALREFRLCDSRTASHVIHTAACNHG